MQIKTMSFSQNTKKEKNNSARIAELISTVISESIEHINIKDYAIKPCHLCGECVNSHTCEMDLEFKRLLKDIGSPDLLFLVVPYYSPYPSKLMIFFEKLNEIFYSGWIQNQTYTHPLQNTKIGLIVHGGLVQSEEVVNYYHTMMNKPLAHTLKGLGFHIMCDDKNFPHGLAFGLEYEGSIVQTKGEVFPEVSHSDDYIIHAIKGYVEFAVNQIKS
jgi:multimeric flavodoxin WrbA